MTEKILAGWCVIGGKYGLGFGELVLSVEDMKHEQTCKRYTNNGCRFVPIYINESDVGQLQTSS